MTFKPRLFLQPDHTVDGTFARYYIGVSYGTLRRLRECNAIPAYAFRSPKGRIMWRYPVRNLHEFLKSHQRFGHAWNPRLRPEMPAHIAALLLGVETETIYTLRQRGSLKNYLPSEVRRYLQSQVRRQLKSHLKTENRELRKRLRSCVSSSK